MLPSLIHWQGATFYAKEVHVFMLAYPFPTGVRITQAKLLNAQLLAIMLSCSYKVGSILEDKWADETPRTQSVILIFKANLKRCAL